jgi:hypothetical protein
MLTLPRPTALLGSLILLAFQPAADQVEFRPADGTEASKSFQVSGNFELGDLTMLVNGQDMSGMVPLDQMAGEFDASFSVIDEYVKTVDGKPIEFVRQFVKSTTEWDMGEESGSEEDWMEMDGETVVFKWNAETKSYDRSYKDGEGDAEKLEDLGINPELLDYRTLLPQKSVSKGDRWSVDPKGMGSALMFGLDFDSLPSMTDEIEDADALAMLEQLKPSFEKMLEGFKTECEYDGTREEGEVTVGVIKVKISADANMDLAQMIEEMARKQIPPEVQVDMTFNTAAITMKLTAEGELLWDIKRGLPHSFTLDGDMEMGFELDASVSAEGQEQAIEMNMEVMGKMNWLME